MKRVFLYLFLVMIFMSFTACNLTKQFGNPTDPNSVSTFAMQTVQALATEQAFSTMVSNATAVSNLPTLIVIDEPTSTPVQNIPNPPQVVAPTNTPMPIFTSIPMDKATFVKDVTFPDNSVIAAGTDFTKTWRLKNEGQTTWSSDYEIIFSSGNAMDGKAANKIGFAVKPGETIDLSVDLKSPTTSGEYKGEWMLRTPGGKVFGVGDMADKTFWVIINVENYQSESVPSEIYPLDFVAKICSAQWKSSFSVVRIPCDTDKSQTKASIAVLSKPKLENGYVDDERTIHMHLEGESGSWMQGFYPALIIKDGATFSSVVGCLEGSKSCNVSISLDASIDGGNPINLGKWIETYDEKITNIHIDLSAYKGKSVELILGISNRSNIISDVFWLAPRIEQ
jgi:hypothetical protein